MLIALLPPQMFLPQKSSEETETEEIPLEEVEEAYIIIAIFYSFGAVLMQDSQLVLDSFVKKLTGYSPFEDEHNEMAPLSKHLFFKIVYKIGWDPECSKRMYFRKNI